MPQHCGLCLLQLQVGGLASRGIPVACCSQPLTLQLLLLAGPGALLIEPSRRLQQALPLPVLPPLPKLPTANINTRMFRLNAQPDGSTQVSVGSRFLPIVQVKVDGSSNSGGGGLPDPKDVSVKVGPGGSIYRQTSDGNGNNNIRVLGGPGLN